ncbi:hypothetical protein Tco_0846125 [Tanacetum coccineum]
MTSPARGGAPEGQDDREGTPPLTKEQIEGHISAMKSIIKDHNKRNKANPIRLNFEIEDQDPNEDRIVKGKEIDDEDLNNKKSLKAKGKGKGKGNGKDKSYIPKPKNPKHLPKRANPAKDDTSTLQHRVESAARILNMVSTKKVDKTTYELWYGKVPNLSYLMICGYEALEKQDTPDRLQQRSFKCIVEGYPKKTMEVNGMAGELEEIQDEDTSPSEKTSKIPMEVEEIEEYSLRDLNEPTKYKAAMLDPESDKWLDAMNAEMQSIKDNHVGPNPEAELRVNCYSNAGFETDRDEIKSQTRYVFILNGRWRRLEKLQAKYYCNVRYRS